MVFLTGVTGIFSPGFMIILNTYPQYPFTGQYPGRQE
jgi:hypothetical protein